MPGTKPNSAPPTTSTIGYGIDIQRANAPSPATPTSKPAMSNSACPIPGSLPVPATLCENAGPVNFDLSDEHRLIQGTVRDFARGEVAPVAEELDRTKTFPYDIVRRLGELNLMGIPFPEEYGGGGSDTLAYALAIEELTRIDSSVAITVAAHTSLGTMPIFLFGTEEQKRAWLPDLASGRRLAAFGLTEPDAGSDASASRT